nr:immunoglobulin heavy chain junction region [Mus musculus]MBK4186618.1 immunoglobulin heavy chain junction region [Mus musculus]
CAIGLPYYYAMDYW